MQAIKDNPTPQELFEAHNQGFKDWLFEKEDIQRWEDFCAEQPDPSDRLNAIKDNHKQERRALLYLSRTKFDPKAFEEEAQTTGDCVSHGARNAVDVTRCVEIHIKGEAEEYIKRSATEPTYGVRGHSGQGMDPGRAAKFHRDFGFLLRKNYPGVVDLSKYNASIGTKWGRGGTPSEVKKLCQENNVGELVVPRTAEQALDCMSSGYAGHSGQSWGTSQSAGSDGINSKSGGWNHDMASVGYDLTEEFFKEPVVFVPNSWADWNNPNPVWLAHQDVYGPWIPGMIVIALDEYEKYFVRSGSIYFYSNVKGFPLQKLPNYGAQQVIA